MRKYVLIAWISLTWLILKNIQPKSTMKMLNGMYVRLIFILFALSNPVLISYSNENMWCVILLSSHRIGIWSLGWIGGCDDSQYSLYGSRISINYSSLFIDNVTSIRAFWIWCGSDSAAYDDQISSGCAMWISWDEWFQHNSTISHF